MNSNSDSGVQHLLVKQFPKLVCTGYYLQFTNNRKLNSIPHNHDFYEIVCLTSGSCVHTLDGVTRNLEPGNTVLIRPGQIHFFDNQSSGTNIVALSFICDEMYRFSEAFGIEDFPQTIMLEQGLLWQLQRLCEKTFIYRDINTQLIMRALLGLILSVFSDVKATPQIDIPPKSFEKLLLQINNIETVAEGVPAFMRMSNFSYSQLCRLTKRYLGKTPGEYVKTLRLQFAYELIKNGILDYEEICTMVGFSSYSHFSKIIKKKFGFTPAQLRKEKFN